MYPNKGPLKELYLAEEAIGLVKSLDWTVAKGPYWKGDDLIEEIKAQEVTSTSSTSDDDTHMQGGGRKVKRPKKDEAESEESEEEDDGDRGRWTKRNSHAKKKRDPNDLPITINKKNLKDGDYIYSSIYKGEYYQGGVWFEPTSSSDEYKDELYHEWKNKGLRESFALGSMVKIRLTKNSTFFGKGKLLELGTFIRDNDIQSVFINKELSPLQIKNLEKSWTMLCNQDPDDPLSNVRIKQDMSMISDIESGTEDNATSSKQIISRKPR
jgi:hypothetical protein